MTRVIHNQTNFSAGELSPRMKGRGDVARYQNGADLIENGIVLVHGGVLRRDGKRYLATAKFGGDRLAILVRYVYSIEQSFMLEFGHEYVRFFDGSTGAVLLDASLAVLEIASPYTEAQLQQITTKQVGETMYLYHPDVPTQVLRRLSAVLWTLLPVRWIVEPFAEIGHLPDARLALDNPAVGAGRTFTTAAVSTPGAPTSPVATPLNGGARVTVVAPVDGGGAPITGYTATSSPGGITATAPGTTITIPGLTNGVSYTFTVTASNKAGAGAASVASNAVTPALGLAGATITAQLDKASWSPSVRNGYIEPITGPTATASDGVAPYTVRWRKVSGSAAIELLSATAAKLAVGSTGYGTTNYADFEATVTDAVGASGSIQVPCAIRHSTGSTGGTDEVIE